MLLIQGDARHIPLADGSVQCCVTSPPYWGLRNYGVDGQLGLEAVPDCLGWATGNPCGECYICQMVAVFREVKRVLRSDGTCWVDMGDCYTTSFYSHGSLRTVPQSNNEWSREGQRGEFHARNAVGAFGRLKPKDLCGIPWRLAFALQADGWYLRSDIIWAKPNPMPESVTDRPTKAHEYLFLLSKSARYYYDADAIREEANPVSEARYRYRFTGAPEGRHDPNGHERICPEGMREYSTRRNRRTVWTIATEPFPGSHFATFPTALVEPCILAGTSERGCCPACGAPWRRVVDHQASTSKQRSGYLQVSGRMDGGGTRHGSFTDATTCMVGWAPTCDCDAGEPVPCIVLDPFSGAGTTGLVASRLGRHYVGLELSRPYSLMAQARITDDAPLLFAEAPQEAVALPLFAAEAQP